MGEINIRDSRGRDAVVSTESVTSPLRVRWIDEQGRQASSRRILKATLDHDLDALHNNYNGNLEEIGSALLTDDPEIDFEAFGEFLKETSRVYINEDREIVHRIIREDIVRNPDGTERERRPHKPPESNVSTEIPLKWTGKMFKKQEVFNKFVFSLKLQIVHINGLTFDFLYNMAKELQEKESLMLMGGGPKANQPLVLRRGSTPYRGFLEGRIKDDKYALILHLSNMELKPLPKEEEGAG